MPVPEVVTFHGTRYNAISKRVIFSMGAKGGVGKTGFMSILADWFHASTVPVTLLDLDIENKAAGSLKHYFPDAVHKISIHTPAGLDAFIDYLVTDSSDTPPIVLADMGAGSGAIALNWFETMYDEISQLGIAFTAVGIVTPDSSTVDSVLAWASRLQTRVRYLIVENAINLQPDFAYWHNTLEAQRFRDTFHPAIISMEFRLPDLENAARQLGATLGQVAGRKTSYDQLRKTSFVLRAQAYRRRIFAELETVADLLLL
jgi:hypothetical protein